MMLPWPAAERLANRILARHDILDGVDVDSDSNVMLEKIKMQLDAEGVADLCLTQSGQVIKSLLGLLTLNNPLKDDIQFVVMSSMVSR